MRIALALVALVALAAPAVADEPPPAPEQPAPATGGPPGAPDPADGGPHYFAAPKGRDIEITSRDDRSTHNMVVLGALAGATVLTGAIGLYYHLDARSASDEVSANKFTGQVWTSDRQDTYDRAHRSSVTAGVFYGLGGALLVTTIVVYIVTEPKSETILIHPHTNPKPEATFAPTPGGALIGGQWTF